MAGMSRTKGKVGERELASLLSDLTGHAVARRVRNLAGEDDLQGLPGWSIECKRYAAITPALIAGWWAQAQRQAQAIGQEPVLFYRADRGAWRAVLDARLLLSPSECRPPMLPTGATVETCPATWWALAGGGKGTPARSQDRVIRTASQLYTASPRFTYLTQCPRLLTAPHVQRETAQ